MGLFDKIRLGILFPGKKGPAETIRMARGTGSHTDSQTGTSSFTEPQAVQPYTKKRRHPRFAVEDRSINAGTLFLEEVSLLNISIAGACIRSERDLAVGRSYLLRLDEHLFSRPINCSVAWKSTDSDPHAMPENCNPAHTVGIRFLDPPLETVVRLKDFMRRYGVPYDQVSGPHKPSPLRFHVIANQSATLRCPEHFKVKKMSIGGMLVESEIQIPPESRHQMVITLPDEKLPLRCETRVASSIERKGNHSSYDIGLEFLTMVENDKIRLQRFLHAL